MINVLVRQYGLSESIVGDSGSPFSSIFWSSLCYLYCIKLKLFTQLQSQVDGQTERQNSIIKVYLCVFNNQKQNNWARFLFIIKFTYNNTKNASISHMAFGLQHDYYFCILFEDEINPLLRFNSADKLAKKLKNLILICQQNLLHTQKFQKQTYDKNKKLCNYTPSENFWLNNKYIKTKQNQKLERKFFDLFRVFHLMGKQFYKPELYTL